MTDRLDEADLLALIEGELDPDRAADLRRRIETAEGEFDRLDLVLVTHSHKDHFNAAAVIRHFGNNPQAQLISTPEVVEAVASEIPIARRHSVPQSVEPVAIRAGGIDVLAVVPRSAPGHLRFAER